MKNFKIGIQLYSVRQDMENDFEGTLKKIKEIGYEVVEFAGYYGKSADEVVDILKKYDLECVSVHQRYEPIYENPEEMIEYLKKLGIKYCITSWMAKDKHVGGENFNKANKEINEVGKKLLDAGIMMGYHNHDFEFEKYNNKFLLDHFYETYPADWMVVQIDTCWCRYAGYNPAEYIKKYAGRMPTIHLKDFVCNNFKSVPQYDLIGDDGKNIKVASREESGFECKPLGEGIQDIKAIIKSAEETGIEYLIVEQDRHTTYEPLESMRRSREYLKKLGL